MKKNDMDFIIKFAAASSAALILSGCTNGADYNTPVDSQASSEKKNAAATTAIDQATSEESSDTQDLTTNTDKRRYMGRTPVLYGPPPK